MHIIRFPDTKFCGLYEAKSYFGSIQTFSYGRIFNKAAFCSREKQGILVDNECSLRYNRVGDFYVSLKKEEGNFNTAVDQYMRSIKTTSLQSVRSLALSAMTVDCERSFYLLI